LDRVLLTRDQIGDVGSGSLVATALLLLAALALLAALLPALLLLTSVAPLVLVGASCHGLHSGYCCGHFLMERAILVQRTDSTEDEDDHGNVG
jgi:hypothetical protein